MYICFYQESEYSNKAIGHLCNEFDECLSNQDPDIMIENLRNIDASLLCHANEISESSVPDWPIWTPVRNDGIFYTENAEEKLKRGDVNKDISYIIGTNSFEGTLFWDEELNLV